MHSPLLDRFYGPEDHNDMPSFRLMGPVAMLMGFAAGFYLMRKRFPLSPRQVRRQNRWAPLIAAVSIAGLAYMQLRQGNAGSAGFLLVAVSVMLGSVLVSWLRTPPPHEAIQNFAVDRGHCGKCEYDLTGNTSGVCPECGWTIPGGELDVDSPGWAIWWRKWDIHHLRNWRRTLAALIWAVMSFVAVGAAMAVYFGIGAAMLMMLMVANFGVNIVRVIGYARRSRELKSVKAPAMKER